MKQSTSSPTSEKLFAKACELIPGGVNSPVRACKNVRATPLFIKSAHGCHLVDADDATYIDFVLSWGPMLLGHADPDVTNAIIAAAKRGTSYGAPCEDEVVLADSLLAAFPALDMVRFVNSGTEATMSALRLARGVTKRTKVVKCIGCYHGHADPFLASAGSGLATFSLPGTPGVPEAVVADTLLVPYNDSDALTDVFARAGEQIAAFILEPVACNMGLVLPKPGYLAHAREITQKYGSLLILDEVITGFRMAYGGAQTVFDLAPDLATFGKIIGGGLPVGAFAGKAELLSQIAPSGPIYQAGTLSGNPLAMAAGAATLAKLSSADYASLERKTATFAHELAAILAKKGVPVQVPTIASMFSVFFTDTPVVDFASATTADPELFTRFYQQMRAQGIYLAPSPYETGMLSFTHTDEDLAQTLAAAEKVVF